MNGWLVVLLIVALCAGALILFIRKVKGMKGDVDAARAEFLEKIGYQYVSALTWKSSPVRRKSAPEGGFTHYFEVYSEGRSTVTVQAWTLECLELRPPQPAVRCNEYRSQPTIMQRSNHAESRTTNYLSRRQR